MRNDNGNDLIIGSRITTKRPRVITTLKNDILNNASNTNTERDTFVRKGYHGLLLKPDVNHEKLLPVMKEPKIVSHQQHEKFIVIIYVVQ